MTLRSFAFALIAAMFGGSAAAAEPLDPSKGLEFFEKRIRPILVESCYECHSAAAVSSKKLRGGLFLDSKDGLLKGGDSGPAIVPGKPKDSLLMKSVHQAGDIKMPPKGKLPDTAIADLEAWIALGAPDPRTAAVAKQKGLSVEEGRQFWSFQPLQQPPIPKVRDAKLVSANEIDAFVLSKLEEKGLTFAPEASPVTLIRRVSYDLIGLPPTPDEVDRFVTAYGDNPQAAYEQLVDRLIASRHFGERWGRHWLDLARYADSLTLRGFVLKEAWRYRDYVIDSFNNDLPFDRFVREQIAGDLLPANSVEQKRRQLAATTFLALGNTNLEEQDKKQLVMDVVDEQLDVISKAILAQTLTCARCHDHKFDPISTRDYYALAGIFKSTKTLTHSNVSKWLEMPLPASPDSEEATKEINAKVAALQQEIAALKGSVAKNTKPTNPAKPTVIALKDLPGIVVDDTKAKKIGAWKESKASGTYIGSGYIHDDGKEKGEKTLTFDPEIPRAGLYEVRLAYQSGTGRSAKVPVTVFSADGDKLVNVDQTQEPEIDGIFTSLGRHNFEINGQSFVIVDNTDTQGIVVADAVQFILVDDLVAPPADKQAAAKGAVGTNGNAAKLQELEGQLRRLQANGAAREMVMTVQEENKIEDCKIHIRGSVNNQGEVAPRGFMQVALIGAAPKLPANQSGRRELADWLASKDNPLTARVYANRAWHWLFGTGLVRTTDNFGVTGEKPSHPELLDFLAARFISDGWSPKKLVRRIVLSRTYRQAVVADPKALAIDPENRLLAHANRRRLDAECIRDTILHASGQLNLDAGGRTFSDGVGSDYNYKHTDTRLSVYAPVFRNSLPELFEAFDFADPSVCNGRRNVSTVAPQALFLMNNPFVLQQSKLAAQRLLNDKALDDAARVTLAFRLTTGRPPSSTEKQLADRFLQEASMDPKARQEQWERFVQTLFASIDFRYVE